MGLSATTVAKFDIHTTLTRYGANDVTIDLKLWQCTLSSLVVAVQVSDVAFSHSSKRCPMREGFVYQRIPLPRRKSKLILYACIGFTVLSAE